MICVIIFIIFGDPLMFRKNDVSNKPSKCTYNNDTVKGVVSICHKFFTYFYVLDVLHSASGDFVSAADCLVT